MTRRVCSLLLLAVLATGGAATLPVAAQMTAAPARPTVATGLVPPATMETLLPMSVWFSGQSAPLQLRNTAGYRDSAGHYTWAGLVDTSGYSTGVREKYQFYFVTERALNIGTLQTPPGVYGGGFLADNTFVLLNIAGNEIGRTPVQVDADMHRPRPLQMTDTAGSLRLYVGRQYVVLTPQ